VRPTTLPNTAEEEAREPAMATDELLQEQRKSAGVRLSSSMPALAPTPRCGSRCRPYRCDPVWFVLAVPDTLAAWREKTARPSAPGAD